MDELEFDWSDEKNNLLMRERGISFEHVLLAIQSGRLIDIIPSPSPTHPEQDCMVIEIDAYAYLVPYVQEGQRIFLKTIYPSRKHTKTYLRGEAHENR